jgi:hypothetical protein
MRRSFPLLSFAISLVFLANPAFAQKKPKAQKAEASAAATWTDPVENEKSDKGPFSPQKTEEGAPAGEPKNSHAPDKGRKRDKVDVFGQLVIGFGGAPQNSPSYEPGWKGTVLGFMLGGRYDFTPAFSAGLRIPLTTTLVKETCLAVTCFGAGNGQTLKSTVFGSPELMGEYRLSLSRLTTLPISFGVGIPVAQGDLGVYRQGSTPAFTNAYANQLADATSGWRDSELFVPKHLPIVIGAGIRHEHQDWELHGDLKFVALPALGTKVSDPASTDAANPGTYKINAFALREVTTLGGTYNFVDKPLIFAGLDLAIVWSALQPFVFEAAGANARPTTLQAVLEPRVGARFGKVAPSVGYIAPLGGRLGDAGDGGIRLRVDAFF